MEQWVKHMYMHICKHKHNPNYLYYWGNRVFYKEGYGDYSENEYIYPIKDWIAQGQNGTVG
jgi:hypothetical protein